MQTAGKERVANAHPPNLAQRASALWAFFVSPYRVCRHSHRPAVARLRPPFSTLNLLRRNHFSNPTTHKKPGCCVVFLIGAGTENALL